MLLGFHTSHSYQKQRAHVFLIFLPFELDYRALYSYSYQADVFISSEIDALKSGFGIKCN